jgi:putative ABC transport system permease protein
VDTTVLLFAILLTAITGLLFGSLPAIRLSSTNLLDPLRSGGRASAGGRRANLRSILVVSEVAFALVLLTGSSLVLKSFWHLLQVNAGFDPESVVTAHVDLPDIKYQKPYQQMQFAESLVERLSNLPDIRGAAISSGLPFKDAPDEGVRIDGRPLGASDSGTTANYYRITPQYFRSMGIPLISGRFFSSQDTASSPPVAIINETMAKRFFPSESPIGRRIDIAGPTYLRQIIGVVGDVKQTGLKAAVGPQVYEPFAQKPSSSFNVIVRGSNSDLLAAAIRDQVSALDRGQPVSKVSTMKETVAGSMSGERFAAILLGIFSALALILAAVGIYGVIAYSVLQRMHEFGIRMAVGAGRADILTIVLRQGLLLTAGGMLIGIGGALFLTRLLTRILFQVSPFDVTSFAMAVLLLGIISAIAFLIPAVRASHLDPMRVLRGE